ncbi:MAG: GTP-binding protein [Candidatus Lokiarchaeota archaeon]|nr:GTP-binding protein [Candidatus Lokiarchaeota archaeon]
MTEYIICKNVIFYLGPADGCKAVTRVYRTLIVGPRNVGKTSLVKRYLYDSFEESYTATVGVDMSVYDLQFPDGRVVVTVLDLAGAQTFQSLKNRFYWDTHHIIAVYDITDKSTFETIPNWYNTISEGLCIPGSLALSGCLVANKVDSRMDNQVDPMEAKLLASLLSWEYYETSAKSGKNVSELFVHAAISCRTNPPRSTYIDTMEMAP